MTGAEGYIMELDEKIRSLKMILQDHSPLLIAYSGGVDSSLLSVMALEELGPGHMHAVLVEGPEVPRRSLEAAKKHAREIGFPLDIVQGLPFSPEIRRTNPHDRCKLCKLGTFEVLDDAANRHECRFIADGANASDLGEHRPGIEAFSSCGVIHPFIMAGISKQEIREIARRKNLSFWNKPSSACLYSRIPYGEEITGEKLHMIEEGENILADLGVSQGRVRHHGTIARIEILPDEFEKVISARSALLKGFETLGFRYIALDLRGYRPGSMDEVLLS